MPPVIALTLGLVAAAALVRWCVKEVKRVNAELDDIRGAMPAESADRERRPTLKRDPNSGEYRPG
jgi:hypothetical protein